MRTSVFLLCACALLTTTQSAVLPPPWADPTKNPCAVLPRGWQLLYWPVNGRCYKIFQVFYVQKRTPNVKTLTPVGYPCPETMELSPSGVGGIIAECKCPPGTAQSPRDAQCHKLFTQGPCKANQYFAPVPEISRKSAKRRWGVCREPDDCQSSSQVFWPPDGRCYDILTRGPCPRGELIYRSQNNMAICTCKNSGLLGNYYWHGDGGTCHEHYTKGPCQSKGELFLPGAEGGQCGCYEHLPHYYDGMCYEIGTIGPCSSGHEFVINISSTNIENTTIINNISPMRASCQCKQNYTYWPPDGTCYRLYTRGPCAETEFLINSTHCAEIPCSKGQLYFPKEKTCYRIGSQGPCSIEEVVIFDFNTRPSVDGISFNGVCGCRGVITDLHMECLDLNSNDICESTPGKVVLNNVCYMLYTQGPCLNGQWLVPLRDPKELYDVKTKAKCECRPGYTEAVTDVDQNDNRNSNVGCHAPSVTLARYLNGKTYKNYKFGFRRF